MFSCFLQQGILLPMTLRVLSSCQVQSPPNLIILYCHPVCEILFSVLHTINARTLETLSFMTHLAQSPKTLNIYYDHTLTKYIPSCYHCKTRICQISCSSTLVCLTRTELFSCKHPGLKIVRQQHLLCWILSECKGRLQSLLL